MFSVGLFLWDNTLSIEKLTEVQKRNQRSSPAQSFHHCLFQRSTDIKLHPHLVSLTCNWSFARDRIRSIQMPNWFCTFGICLDHPKDVSTLRQRPFLCKIWSVDRCCRRMMSGESHSCLGQSIFPYPTWFPRDIQTPFWVRASLTLFSKHSSFRYLSTDFFFQSCLQKKPSFTGQGQSLLLSSVSPGTQHGVLLFSKGKHLNSCLNVQCVVRDLVTEGFLWNQCQGESSSIRWYHCVLVLVAFWRLSFSS